MSHADLESHMKHAYDATWCGWNGLPHGDASVHALATEIVAAGIPAPDIQAARDALAPVLKRCVISRARDRVLHEVQVLMA